MRKTAEFRGQTQEDTLEIIINEFISHPFYDVKDENDNTLGINIILKHFGPLWRMTLDRMDHQIDGYLLSIQFKGQKFRVYRKHKQNRQITKLHLVVP